jgi:transcriptional regulator with XRE-family HTH domain
MGRYTNTSTRRARRQLSEYVTTWRKLQNLTAGQVAERAGISLSTYSRLENDGDVRLSAFMDVARALGVLGTFVESLDPYESDLGRARSDQQLPKRVR